MGEHLAQVASHRGFEGLELATWGQCLERERAVTELHHCAGISDVLRPNNLQMFTRGPHLVGQVRL